MAAPSAEPTAAPFPERIGRYELLLPIGTGGMATVFLARAGGVGGFERDVAVKIIHAHLRADEESKNHLLDEARLAARIRHPNVVPVLEVGDDPFGVYLVMDYVEGDSLSGLQRLVKSNKEKIPPRIAARVLSDALSGLHAAHELVDESGKVLGLVHRDFSPQNILIGVDGVARLSDFSVAKAGERAVRTRTGLVKGKIAYMSPEQARGHTLDRRCDVWAAGVVAWELIAGRRLHKKVDAVSTLLSVVTEVPPNLSSVVPNVPEALEDVVWRALSMDVERRIGSALELRRELETAFRNVDGIADSQEVAEYVTRLFGSRLEERRQRTTEVRKLRARMGEIARPSMPPDTEDSPRLLEPPDTGSEDEPDSGQRTRREPAVRPRDLEARTTTEELPQLSGATAGFTVQSARVAAKRWRRVAVVGLGLALLATGFGLLALRGERPGDTAAEKAPPPLATPSEPGRAPPAAAAVAAAPVATELKPAEPSAESKADKQRTASRAAPRSSPRVERASSGDPAPPRAAPRSSAPTKLAKDPYGAPP